ncbi:MAG: type II toxin-antitoxin system VapC family toxin [Actinobacteria bacterium]|nr:type II toxin-antitoxin system VapC family toxin [Actinomycetota bacterium]MBI3257159.1 type II toxin-antitoxin system VapC family toxin [Actinomycetota bacterium]
MALVYFDSSALVKLVLDEAGSDTAAALWNACDAALSSRLAYPEVCAALAAAGRNHDLTESEAAAAAAAWEIFWASMRPVELSADIEQTAGALASRHHLRGADAVHLASALALSSRDLTVAVWDKRLHEGAAAVGLAVAPANLR